VALPSPQPTPSLPKARPVLRLVPAPSAWRQDPDLPQAPYPIPGQQALNLTYLLRGGLPALPEPAEDLSLPAPRLCGPEVIEEAGVPTDRAVLPPAGPWSARLAQAFLEVCTAGRPINQLSRWTSPAIYEDLRTRYAPAARRASRNRGTHVVEKVRSVHICEPANGVVEAAAVIVGGPQTRALALRLEGWRGRWICTALEWI